MRYSWCRTAVGEGKLQVIYICSTSIPAQTAVAPDPPQVSRPPRHQNAEWRKQLSGIPCPLPRECLSESGHCGSRPSQPVCKSHLVELPSLAKPANRWNLPIAGVAVQINRVQYSSLSALVREGRPIFVMCTQQCSAHIRLGRRDRYNV